MLVLLFSLPSYACRKLRFSLASASAFWRRHNRPGKYRQELKTRDPLHSREAMLAPLHPRLTPDPPSADELHASDFIMRDYQSHATSSAFTRDPSQSSSHTQSGAGQRGRALRAAAL